MSCDDSSLFRCVTRIQAINFFRKVKYNLLNETIWRIFLVICFIYIFLAYSGYTARSLMTMFVCYNYADKFLHIYIESHVSQRLLTLAKHSSIMEELLTSFGALIWCQIFRGNKAWFLAKQTIAFLSLKRARGKRPWVQCKQVILWVELTKLT